MREKHLWIALVLAILCTLGVRAATADELSSKTRPLNMTGTWYTTGWPWPNDNMFYLVAFKKPTEEQGTILGFWKWYGYFPDSTSIQRWHISGWYISNYFEITATNPLPIAPYYALWVLYRGIQVDATQADGDFSDSLGNTGEFGWTKAFSD
jgi:hypothetical protein